MEPSLLEMISHQGVVRYNANLSQLYDTVTDAKNLIQQINQIITSDISSYYKDGSLMATVANKREAVLSRNSELEIKLASLIADMGVVHGAKLYHDDHGVISVSHLVKKYKNEPLDLYTLLISDVFEMDISELVNPALYHLFDDNWSEWKCVFNSTYQCIEQKLHSSLANDPRMKEIKNDRQRRILAGLADHHKIYRLLGIRNVKSHRQQVPFDERDIHDQFYEEKNLEQVQICSEFATKVTIAALMELNIHMTKYLLSDSRFEIYRGNKVLQLLENKSLKPSTFEKKFLIEDGIDSRLNSKRIKATLKDKMLKAGYLPNQVAVVFSLIEKKVIKLPYDPRERLETIHPGRMVKPLVKSGCVKKVPPPKVISDLIIFN